MKSKYKQLVMRSEPFCWLSGVSAVGRIAVLLRLHMSQQFK
jgi:hypothetical protein